MRTLTQIDSHLGHTNYLTEITAKGFRFVSDEPVADGGQGAGPAPYDYILAGLAACTLMTLRMYAERKGWQLGELDLHLSLSKDADKHTHIHRTLKASAELAPEQWNRLLEICAKTPVTLTLAQGSTITTSHEGAA